jgi:hypothetical protein
MGDRLVTPTLAPALLYDKDGVSGKLGNQANGSARSVDLWIVQEVILRK